MSEKIPDNQKGVAPIKTLGGTQQMSIIYEACLYRLLMRSDKSEAEPFIARVTEEVLPTIRKTGGGRPTNNNQSITKENDNDE